MKEDLLQILALQDKMREADQIRRDTQRLAIDIDNQARVLDKLKLRAQQAHDQRVEAAKKADAVQLNIEQAEEQIEHFRAQLNVTRQQHQYDALQHAILSKQADISKWEDDELAALQAVDDLTQQQKLLARQTEEAEAELARIREGVARQTAELTGRLEEVEDECYRMRRRINPAVLATYERLAASDRATPLAEVKGRVCQGCFTQITKQSENMLMRDLEIVYCHSCGRMLILADE